MKARLLLVLAALCALPVVVDAGEVVKRTVRYGNSSVSSQYVFQSSGSSSYRGTSSRSYSSSRYGRSRYARTSYCRTTSPYVVRRNYYYPGYRTTSYRYPSRVYVTRPQVLRTASRVVVVKR
ncbi:MAG: hypothetical protein AAGJ79_04460 [Verrucomicrobiota bacterium]